MKAETSERLTDLGAGCLSVAELFEVLGIPRVGELAAEYGLPKLSRAVQPEDLDGLTPAAAAKAVAVFELGRRVSQASIPKGTELRAAQAAYDYLRPQIAHLDREVFIAVLLDVRLRVIRTVRVAEGTGWACAVQPRDAITPALREGAAAVLFAHNHPSGDPTPSNEDKDLTRRLSSACELLGVRMVDHIVVAREGYVSFRETGAL